jgi:adenylate cyclase
MLLRLPFVFMSCLLATGWFVLYDHGWLRELDNRWQDQLQFVRPADQDILIIAIDNQSIAELGVWPWPRTFHAELLQTLEAAGPAVIGYDVTFADPGPRPEADAALAQALEAAGPLVIASEAVLEIRDQAEPLVVSALDPDERFGSVLFGPTTLVPDADGVVRQAPLRVDRGGSTLSFATQIASLVGTPIPEPANGLYRIPYAGGPGHFVTYPFADVLKGRVSPEVFQEKIVLVGATAPDLHDEFLTPQGQGAMTPGVEIQANILQALRAGRQLQALDDFQTGLVMAVLTLILLGSGLVLPLRYVFAANLTVGLGYIVIAVAVVENDILLPLLHPLLLVGGITALDVLHRYKDEHGRRQFIEQAFGRYVAGAVVERLVKGQAPLQLGGSKQELTILFSDIRGFTSFSETLPPEKLISFLNGYLGVMTEIVLTEEGTLDKYIGDAVMAFWGAPIAQPDHARRAVAAALRMRQGLAALNAEAQRNGWPEIEIGIGVNTGPVIVGNVGSEKRFDYTVIGDDVNLASRLESLTKFYGVGLLITGTTNAALGDTFLTRLVDTVAVKGKAQAVRIYEVLHTQAEATAEQRALAEVSEQAFGLYAARKFKQAGELFQKCNQPILAARCQAFHIAPPSLDWDGVYRPESK